MKHAWKEELHSALSKKFGLAKGKALYAKYKNAFHTNYYEESTLEMALNDISHLEQLSTKKPFAIEFYQVLRKAKPALHLRLFQYDDLMPLSDTLPVFHNMDLRTFNEYPYEVKLKNSTQWISDFNVSIIANGSAIDIKTLKPLFQEAFEKIITGACENDGFNKLVLRAGLSWREITILRAYAKYLQQTAFRFSPTYIEQIVVKHAAIVELLIKFFTLRFALKPKQPKQSAIDILEKKILTKLDEIVELDDDRIMRHFFLLIKATLRTNYFLSVNGKYREYLAFKFNTADVPELPLPHPLYEIFVYATRFEAIHLRGAKVSRGGIRWSDRREDLRTEILGLMKVQRIKNAVIVPTGAKGGFVLKTRLPIKDKKKLAAEVVHCYEAFIRGLLDLTDNIKAGVTLHPKGIVCYDDYDPYLVVAADKGTSEFSDIANGISKEYNFWLGDAFASGGSTGYNHKEMGITARGAWESIRRHFRELNIDIDLDAINIVGIGDMSGDVFGNGMIYSKHIKLIAAFDHRDIFIDPNPDPKKSFQERLRLFKLPTSSWQNYNAKLVSSGGGVFSRASKSIPLSKEIKKLLDIEKDSLTPDELICAILKASVDLLYNGGIGTYVKSSLESNEDVGDKANDFCRINGNELHCRVVGEGGNLGLTPLGRIEYAMQGGLIFTDFIDNSAGVDCSDHEVNIKILLDKVVLAGKLTEKARNTLLVQMQDEVAALVLKDNFNQALSLNLSMARTLHNTGLYQSYLKELESIGEIDRSVESLPDDKLILERKAAELGFTAPEIAILFAYSKINIKNEILKTNLPEQSYFRQLLAMAFPKTLQETYGQYMQEHRLQREIIATILSNKIVNEMGVTFVYREQTETGATVAEIIHAYTISARIYASAQLETIIESLSFKVSAKLQYDLLHHVRHLLNLSTRWFLRSHYLKEDIAKTIKHFAEPIERLAPMIQALVSGNTKTYLDKLAEQFVQAGIPCETATRIATYRALYILLNVIEVATQYEFDLIKTAKIYFDIGSKFNLVWFRDHIANDVREGYWNNLARLTLRDELDILQKLLTVVILKANKKVANVDHLIDDWMAEHPRPIENWDKVLQMLHGSTNIDYSMFFVALRELSDWIHASEVL